MIQIGSPHKIDPKLCLDQTKDKQSAHVLAVQCLLVSAVSEYAATSGNPDTLPKTLQTHAFFHPSWNVDVRAPPLSSPKLRYGITAVMPLGKRLISIPLSTRFLLLVFITLTILLTFPFSANRPSFLPSPQETWLPRISEHPYTQRIACREYDAGAQSCVFAGLACINTSIHRPFKRPKVYILHNNKTDREKVPSDEWCEYRHQSSDPRYFSSRHWPIRPDTFAPQRSCLDAEFRHLQSLQLHDNVKWLPNLWLVDLDNVKNDHNNHLLKDILWMLDVNLWEDAIDLRKSPDFTPPARLFNNTNRYIYLPQGQKEFIYQTARDVNRLIYSLVLQLDPVKLYPNLTREQLHSSPVTSRITTPLLEAYPQLTEQLLFHRDLHDDNHTDLVCAPSLTVGAKLGNGGHERVCRYLRQTAYDVFGISRPVKRRLGRIYYEQPPKRVLILQRHISRRLANVEEVETAIRSAFSKYGVAVEMVDTRALETAEAQVRIFSRAGIVITPHGSQAMGQIFMPRHSALIEIMPVGYTDYAFNLLAESCRIWYYELQGVIGGANKEHLMKECGKKIPHMMTPCLKVKFHDVWADVGKVVETVKFALERMGYAVGEWLE